MLSYAKTKKLFSPALVRTYLFFTRHSFIRLVKLLAKAFSLVASSNLKILRSCLRQE